MEADPVEFHVAGQRGSPFEQLFVVPEGAEESVADEVCGFVYGILDEEIVLVVEGRLFRHGRRWVHPDQLRDIQHLSMSASWRGSFDGPERGERT